MGTAKIIPPRLHSMADNLARAMLAVRRQRLNGAFEAVKVSGNPVHENLQRFIVFVPANFTFVHATILLLPLYPFRALHAPPRRSVRARRLRLLLRSTFRRRFVHRQPVLWAPAAPAFPLRDPSVYLPGVSRRGLAQA